MEPFTLTWHRAGNSAAGIDAVVRVAGTPGTLGSFAGRPLRHGVECDLKWTFSEGGTRPSPLLYLHHGPTGLERLTAQTVSRRAAAGELLLLEDALARPGAASLHWMVELKRGHGSTESAVAACVALFERHGARERLLFASSSLATLGRIRRAHPEVATALFVTWVFRDGSVLQVPKSDVAAGLQRGLRHAPPALADVNLFVCTNPLTAGRRMDGGVAQAPIARSLAQAEAFAAAGLAGAFAYFTPASL